MSKLQVVRFDLWHIDEISVRGLFHCLGDLKAKLSRLESHPGAVTKTVLIDFKPAAVIGLVCLWPGVAEAWALTSDRVQERPIEFHKTVRSLLRDHMKQMGLNRVHLTVPSGYAVGNKWAKALGFDAEAVLKSYGPDGSDHTIFRMVGA